MPPFVLPAEHFVAALLWLGLGAGGLVAVAPELAAGGFLQPRSIAVVHCFTLGWVVTCIFGALYQVYPVALGVGARSIPLAHATFWTLQAGIAFLVVGAWSWRPVFLAVGGCLFLGAVGAISWNLLPQRRWARRGREIGLYVAAAFGALGLAMLLVAVSVAFHAGWWPAGWPAPDRAGILTAHAHLAAVGFATLVAVGVGSKLIPMFLLSRKHAEWPLRWVGPAVLLGLLMLAAGTTLGPEWLAGAGGVTVAGGLLLYLRLAAGYFTRRTRRELEPALAHVAVAHLFLGVAVALGLWMLIAAATGGTGTSPRLAVAYGAFGLLGWLTLLVVGVYLKVVPFLTWLHRFSSRVGEPDTPKVGDLVHEGLARGSLALLPAGTLLLAAGAAVGGGPVVAAGAATFAAGTVALLLQMGRLAWLR